MALTQTVSDLEDVNLLISKLKSKQEELIKSKVIRKPKLSKISAEEIPFDIPSNWRWVRLSDVSIIQEGPGIRKYQYTKEGMRFLTVTNITEEGIKLEKSIKYVSQEEFESKYTHFKINNGDIVCSCSGASWGKSALFYEDIDMMLNTSTLRLRFFGDLGDNIYLYYLTKTKFFKKQIEDQLSGMQPNFGYAHYSKILIPIPPLQIQKRIVAILDEAFEKISSAKENTEKNLKNAKEVFESYLQSVFENKGEGWEEKKLNEISENLDGKRIPITKKHRIKGPIPYYGASGVVDHVKDYIFDEELLLISEDGANLLARTYPIAFSISGKSWVNNHAHVLRFNDKTSQIFVELYLNSIKLDDFVSGMAQPKLNQKMLNKIPIPFPPLKEQQIIVSKTNTLSQETKKLESIYNQKLADLEELKQSILQKAFNGELTEVSA